MEFPPQANDFEWAEPPANESKIGRKEATSCMFPFWRQDLGWIWKGFERRLWRASQAWWPTAIYLVSPQHRHAQCLSGLSGILFGRERTQEDSTRSWVLGPCYYVILGSKRSLKEGFVAFRIAEGVDWCGYTESLRVQSYWKRTCLRCRWSNQNMVWTWFCLETKAQNSLGSEWMNNNMGHVQSQ